MNRRDTVLALLALGASPLAAFAQGAGKIWHIGFLAARSRSTSSNPDVFYDAFVQKMRELGYIEGKNLVIEWRFANGHFELLPALATELAQMKVDAIVTHALPPTLAAQRATSTIPIIFASMSDPVGNGVVKSLARPEGNVTGSSLMSAELIPKQVELLASSMPKLARIAFLVNPLTPAHPASLKSAQTAAKKIGARILAVEARNPEQIERGFGTMADWKAEALIVPSDGFFIGQGRQLAQLGLKHRISTISEYLENVEAGCLLSYGQDITGFYRRAAEKVDKILKGAKPSDLPIEQPMIFTFAVNLKTAKALGLKIPPAVLMRADRVIE
jgi:putative tryptophan/tyrosine transport system substrate-binding protein